jgi:hypothetical protein
MLRKILARAWRLQVAFHRPDYLICPSVRGGSLLGLPLLKLVFSVSNSKLFLPFGTSPRLGHFLGLTPVLVDAASTKGTVGRRH